MDDLVIMSLGYNKHRDEERRTDECSKEVWNELLKDYSPSARGFAATMAAHNWDVLCHKGQIIISGRKYRTDSKKDGWVLKKEDTGYYQNKLSEEVWDELYEGTERKF